MELEKATTQLPKNSQLRPMIMWALTYRCNLRCRYCYLFTQENVPALDRSEAPPHVVAAIADSLTKPGSWRPQIVWLTGGEPTLHPQLSSLIAIFERAGVMTVVTTNGVIESGTAYKLAAVRPRGIMVSLDLETPSENKLLRGGGKRILDTIDLIVQQKNSYTTLGVAVVISNRNRERLSTLAKFLEQRGVEYISVNPLYHNNPRAAGLRMPMDPECGLTVLEQLEDIANETNILIPGAEYRELLSAYFQKINPPKRDCPAAFEYSFISPWGQVYPCSNEYWHSDRRMIDAPMAASVDFSDVLQDLKARVDGNRFTSRSPCYSTRCLGCWKLYYDAVFN